MKNDSKIQKHIINQSKHLNQIKPQKQQIFSYNKKDQLTKMKQPNQDNRKRKKQQQLPQTNLQMKPKQSNYSVSSEVSFNGDNKKQKSKSFNRRQGNQTQEQESIVSIYRQLQYPPEIRNALKKFCYLDKEKLFKLSVNQLRQLCQKELKRIDLLRRNNVHIQRLLSEQQIQDTDNELSLIAISSQVNALVEYRNQLSPSQSNGNETTAKTRLRQYETILLQIEKSDQLIKNFINTHLKLPEPSDISIPDCKRFFKKQAYMMSQSSDRIVLSRKTLCEIIIFLCRLLEGQILAFDDIYQYQDESFNSIEFGDDYNKSVIQSRNLKNTQVIVQNLDQSFSDSHSQQSRNSLKNGHPKGNPKNGNNYQSYSNDGLGKKVKQLAGICEQIPQLQAFTRTLKFSKITLQNRQSFFKIVDVIIALHHRIGYLSRNKPTLMKEIEHIEHDLTEVYETLREFVVLLTSEVPQFGELRFKSEQDAKHQLTETISYLKKDMRKLAEIIRDQNETEKDLHERLQLLRAIIQTFCQSLGQGDESIWQQYTSKVLKKPLNQQQRQLITWLTQFTTTILTQLRSGIKNQQDLQTQKKLQAQVHTLLTDYERLRGEHQQLQGKYNLLLEHKDELVFDIEERDKIIGNLTSIKISSEKREKSLRDQLLQAQDDASRFEHDLGLLQEQLEIISIENQNKINQLVYEHQTQVKQLVDKITMLQRTKMQLSGKFQQECTKSIRLMQDGNYSSVQMQTLKDRLQKKIKEHDENNKKQKEQINLLEKQLQEVKNDKSLLENKLQLAEKNKNKLMDKLQEVNNKYNHNVKDFQDKYQQQIIAIKQAHYKMEKQLQKYKRNNTLLTQQIQQLKQQNITQSKTSNQYRMKLIQFNSLQNQYDSLVKEYDRVVDSFHKLQTNNETLKQKLFELTAKQQEILELLAREKDVNRKLDKKCKEQDGKLQDIINSYQGNDLELREQQKINKMLQKKISQLESQVESLQQSLLNKDKTHSLTINKSEIKFQQLNGQLQQQINKLKKTNSQLYTQNDKLLNQLKIQQKQLKQQISDHQHKQIDWQQKDKEWTRSKGLLEKKLSESQAERLQLEEKLRQLQEQSYNQSILIQEIKQEKTLYQMRVSQMKGGEKIQLTQLRKGIQEMQLTEKSLKNKISKLQSQVQRLCGEIQELKQIIKQKDREIQKTYQEANRKVKQKQAQEQQKKYEQYELKKTQEITQLRQQIMIEKNIIITEKKKLHQENNTLHEEIAKLRALNEALQKNIDKLYITSTQTKQQLIKQQNNFKLTINKHLFTISSLENELTSINTQREMLRKDYQQLHNKLQAKSKALAEKDNLLFDRQLQKNNLQKVNKQIKFKISQLQNTIEGLNASIDKMKNTKIKGLEQEILELTGLVQEWKKKEQLARGSLYDLQLQIQKLKRDNFKKLQTIKQQHSQLQHHYQSQLKKLQSQHIIELSSLQHKTRKHTQNQFNQLLIKQKETFNNLTIQKIEELADMQKKYQKFIKDQRCDKNLVQEECNRLQRELSQFKRNKAINQSRIMQQQQENNTLEDLKKLKSQYEVLKRQHSRLQQQNNRLSAQLTTNRQQNSILLSKSLQSQHTITILTSKVNLLTQNLQNTKKSLQQMHKLQLDKLNLQRQVDRFKAKAMSDDNRIHDYKGRMEEMDQRIVDLEGKLLVWRNKEFEWTRANDQSTQRFRTLNNQSTDMSLKLQQIKQKLSQMTLKLTQKSQTLQTVQSQLQLTQQKVRQKQIQLSSIKQHLQYQITLLQQQLSKKSTANIMLQKQKKQLLLQWEHKENELMQESEVKGRRLKELEIELSEYRRNVSQGNIMVEELTKVRNEKMEVEVRCGRLELQVGKLKADELTLQRDNDLLNKQLTGLNNDKTKLLSQLRNLQHQIKLLNSQNQQISTHYNELLEELKKTKQLSIVQMKTIKDQLITQFQSQRSSMQSHYQGIINQLNEQLSKQRQKHQQLINKYNKLLQQLSEAHKITDILRKQNMQLSDHCQKYQARIHLLEERLESFENDHQLKGQSTQEIQGKFKNAQFQLNKINDLNSKLKEEVDSLGQKNLSLKRTIAQLQKQLQNAIKNNKLLEQKLNQLNHIISQKSNQLTSLKVNTTNSEQKLTQTIGQLQCMNNSNNLLIDKLNKSQKELQLLANQFAILQQRLREVEGYIQWSDNERKGLEQRLALLLIDLQKQKVQNQQFRQKIMGILSQLEKSQLQAKSLQTNIFELQGQKSKKQYKIKNLSSQNSQLSTKLSQLQTHLKTIQNQQKLNQFNKSTQQSSEIMRLQAQLALTRQQLVRLNQVINRKQEEFEKDIMRLTEEKGKMWKENQLLAQQYQALKSRFDQMERINQLRSKQLQDLKQDKLKLINQIDQSRKKLNNTTKQLAHLNQLLSQSNKKQQQIQRLLIESQRKQQQLTRTLINQQNQVRRISLQNDSIKNRLSLQSQKDQQLKLSQTKFRQQTQQLSEEIATLQSQLALMRMEYSRLHGEHNKVALQITKLNDQLHLSNEQIKRLTQQLTNQRLKHQHLSKQSDNKGQTITQLQKKLQHLNQQSSNKNTISSNMKQDLDKAYQQLNHLRSIVSRLQSDILNLNTHLSVKDKIINEMKNNVNKGNQLMENADKELKKSFQERNALSNSIKHLTQQRDNLNNVTKQLTQQRDSYLQIVKMRQSQTMTLKETITILEKRITQMTTQITNLSTQMNETSFQHQQLNQSRSNINLVTKSYSYQGGQVTSAELARLEEQNKRLIKEIQSRHKTITHQSFEIQTLNKEIKILKEQIHLLSQGKIISIKGYTRVTNPNDNTLNTKGIIYTQYDVKEMKAKIQLLEKSLARYQDRQTQLLRQIEKYKFRQRHLTQQVKVLQENAKTHKLKQPDSVQQILSTNSPQKKTSFDQQYNNRQNQPQSSTYRIQTGIQFTQKSIKMTKKQLKTTQKYFLRVESEQLRKIIERLTHGQQIVNSKIDQILNTAQRTNKESLELVLTNNQFNLTPVIINEIRQLIHQNKALVQTLKSMKQFKQDVGLLIQQYIDPQLLTQFVYRVLTYFSEVSDPSPQAKEIRNQLNMIRKNNVGGYYFTVLEQYTKYILENNSIEIYKEELRQKARELIGFRQKFQAIIDSKLDENDKLLNRSDSKNSFLNKSRTKYMGSSRMGSSRGKSECSEISRDDNSRVKEIVPATNIAGNNNGTRISLPVGQSNVLPNPINLLTGAGNNVYTTSNQHNLMQNFSLSPGLITAERPRTSSTLTYTPYNKLLIPQSSTPTQSVNDSRVHVSYSATSTTHVGNSSYTTINSSNFMKPGLQKKL